MSKVLAIVLGGGKGTRLYPLTKDRAKPAVPFGGKYRIVDIPISNCINAGFNQVYILTQFNSASLHLHISRTYTFDSFSQGYVQILAAEQTLIHSGWYEGTADAVRKNLQHFRTQNPTHYLIVSGDQLYRMNLADMMRKHVESKCGMTIACTPVTREEACSLGIMAIDPKSRIKSFIEKPPMDINLGDYKLAAEIQGERRTGGRDFLASMGIYIFNQDLMEKCLENKFVDFGKEIIPDMLKTKNVNAYVFNGYWEDIGTIKSFYDANLELTAINPRFNFYEENMPIHTHKRNLPPSKLNYCTLNQALAAEGCIITNSSISHSIIGIRTIIESGASLDGVVCMGADYYETLEQRLRNRELGIPDIGIAKGSVIKNAIIDKNARIGENCRIGIDQAKPYEDGDFGNYYIADGIIIIPKNSIIQPGTVI